MAEGNNSKRKQSQGGSHGAPAAKKSKGGNSGRWRTPHQQAKMAGKVEMGTTFDVGDEGIWVTFAKGMKFKAVREFKELCESYGKEMYGIATSDEKAEANADEDDDKDIEESIEKELERMRTSQQPKTRQTFTPVSTGIECLFFMKTMRPVEPDRLALRICQDARKCTDPMQRKVRYVNRLVPVLDTDKASEKGIPRVARAVLAPYFKLNPEGDAEAEKDASASSEGDEAGKPPCTYAIRQNIRNHDLFRSDALIKKVAGLIDPAHKVNLTNPDKVILIEIFQAHCGMSVVDAREWESLKRYNINEVYKLASEDAAASEEKPEGAAPTTSTS